MSIGRQAPKSETYTLDEAKQHVLDELKEKISGDCSLRMDIVGEGEYEAGDYKGIDCAEDLASSLEHDWFAVKLSNDLDEEWLFVEYRAHEDGDDYELDSSDDESEGERQHGGLDIPDYRREGTSAFEKEAPERKEQAKEEEASSGMGWFSSAMSLVSSIAIPKAAPKAAVEAEKEQESDLDSMRRSMLAMETQLKALQQETASLRSSLSGSALCRPLVNGEIPSQPEGDLTFEAAPPLPPPSGPPPPPPPLPESGKIPAKKRVTVTKAVVRKKRTRKDVRKDLHGLITRSDLTPVNYEEAYQNFLECFRYDKKLKKLDRLVRLYGDLVKSLPTKPKTCFMKMCLWEKELFHKLDEKVARKWRASKMKKIIELEGRDEVLAEIALVEKALDYERKQAKIAAATKNAGRNRNSMMLELSGILSSKQNAEEKEKAQAELQAMEKTPIGEDELEGTLLPAAVVSIS